MSLERGVAFVGVVVVNDNFTSVSFREFTSKDIIIMIV